MSTLFFYNPQKGCGLCSGCNKSPIRGNYDGLVVLAAVTRETLPNYPNYARANTMQAKKQQEKLLDHVQFAMNLEYTLTTHFMYNGNSEYQSKCVPSTRMAIAAGEAIGTIHILLSAYRSIGIEITILTFMSVCPSVQRRHIFFHF